MSCEIIHICNIVLQVQRPGTGSRNRSNSSALRSVMLGNFFRVKFLFAVSGVLERFTLRPGSPVASLEMMRAASS